MMNLTGASADGRWPSAAAHLLRQEGQGSAVWVLDRATMTVRSQPVVDKGWIYVGTEDGKLVASKAGKGVRKTR